MNSIKTFWSPELKKERALRKDEATKISVWKEQYRVVQDETQVGNIFDRELLFISVDHLYLFLIVKAGLQMNRDRGSSMSTVKSCLGLG